MSKTLVVFYSYSGNTKLVAEKIRNKLNCDLLEIKPEIPFSSDYQIVVDEWQNNSIKRDVKIKDINVNLDLYDKIVIGTPIWWYTVSPVITAFIKKYDLKNKTIYPFYTSAGWFGRADTDFRKLCESDKIKECLKVTFDSDYSKHLIISNESEINLWINKIEKE